MGIAVDGHLWKITFALSVHANVIQSRSQFFFWKVTLNDIVFMLFCYYSHSVVSQSPLSINKTKRECKFLLLTKKIGIQVHTRYNNKFGPFSDLLIAFTCKVNKDCHDNGYCHAGVCECYPNYEYMPDCSMYGCEYLP